MNGTTFSGKEDNFARYTVISYLEFPFHFLSIQNVMNFQLNGSLV